MAIHLYLRRIASILFMAAISSGNVLADSPGKLSDQQNADALMKTDSAFGISSAKRNGFGGLAAAFADDVIVPLPGKGFADGKDAVIAALGADAGMDAAQLEWSPVRVGISADGNQGFSFGFMDQHQADGTTSGYKYLAYWRRRDNGWKIIAWKRSKRADGEVPRQPMSPLLPGKFPAQARLAALETAEQAFSDEAQTIGLGPAFAKFGTLESMNLGGSGNAGFVFGATAIAQHLSAGQPDGGSTLNWSADRVVVSTSGDLGVSIGAIRFNATAADGSKQTPIPFFTVWRRAAADQPWRYIAE